MSHQNVLNHDFENIRVHTRCTVALQPSEDQWILTSRYYADTKTVCTGTGQHVKHGWPGVMDQE